METCPVCGTAFDPITRTRPRSYCSVPCREKAYYDQRVARYQKDHGLLSRICFYCQNPVGPKYKYCSPECNKVAKSLTNKRNKKPHKRKPIPATRICKHCLEVFIPATHTSTYCSRVCKRLRAKVLMRERGVRINKGYTGWTEQRKTEWFKRQAIKRGANPLEAEHIVNVDVFERDQWICGICNLQVDQSLKYPNPMSASLDHVIPLSKGGQHTRMNTQCAHLRCNIRKNNKINYVISPAA